MTTATVSPTDARVDLPRFHLAALRWRNVVIVMLKREEERRNPVPLMGRPARIISSFKQLFHSAFQTEPK